MKGGKRLKEVRDDRRRGMKEGDVLKEERDERSR